MTKQKKFITCDGNQAAAHISYMFSEVAAIYHSAEGNDNIGETQKRGGASFHKGAGQRSEDIGHNDQKSL